MDEPTAVMIAEVIKNAQDSIEPEPLSIEQERAVLLLMTGATDAVVAEQVGVSRMTVNRWKNLNPAFRLALESARRQAFERMRDRLRGLAEKAVAVIEGHLAENSLPAAIAVLKGCGFSDPNLIRQEMEDRERFLVRAEQAAFVRAFRREIKDYAAETLERDAED